MGDGGEAGSGDGGEIGDGEGGGGGDGDGGEGCGQHKHKATPQHRHVVFVSSTCGASRLTVWSDDLVRGYSNPSATPKAFSLRDAHSSATSSSYASASV